MEGITVIIKDTEVKYWVFFKFNEAILNFIVIQAEAMAVIMDHVEAMKVNKNNGNVVNLLTNSSNRSRIWWLKRIKMKSYNYLQFYWLNN